MKSVALFVIKCYQNYISKFIPSSCRYYPTCSEYAIWQFKYNNFFIALITTFFRILRCNKFFRGGVDYPIVSMQLKLKFNVPRSQLRNVNFWFVPRSAGKFYVIKTLGSKEK